MATTKDWLPTTREGVLAMASDWIAVCLSKMTEWNIPKSAITAIQTLRQAAAAALETAKNETTRTPVATAQCKETFDALIAGMRDFKRRYFLSPPLLDSGYIALGLKPRDSHPTPSGIPTSQVMVETYLVGRHELGLRIVYIDGNPNDPANKGYRIWYKVVAPGETPPSDPDRDLTKSFFTKRKKDVIEFEFGDSGKTAHFAVQIENDGKKGPWGPLAPALIP
ncbi:MAG: hypothetical protein LBH85_06680 [Treponema sp.]|jgi:hypothetical protein|nr:hypothetical protein [Treponema sp.]